ncbi:MAG TPA: hypothetical protein VJO99_18110, partial [Burkholderiaceae bacterium]|nr:hypothetical protein [Burkholderiaceae bacterium]
MKRRTLLHAGGLSLAAPALLAAGCAAVPGGRTPAARGAVDPDELALLNRLTWGVDSAAVAD